MVAAMPPPNKPSGTSTLIISCCFFPEMQILLTVSLHCGVVGGMGGGVGETQLVNCEWFLNTPGTICSPNKSFAASVKALFLMGLCSGLGCL